MRILYFDIDGTLLTDRDGKPKRRLAGGALESAVRSRGFDRLICVGSIVDVLEATMGADRGGRDLDTVFRACGGVFENEEWFRENVVLVRDSRFRASEVKQDQDWWFADDLAERYFHEAGLRDLFDAERGRRIVIPEPNGDGSNLLRWLLRIPERRRRTRPQTR